MAFGREKDYVIGQQKGAHKKHGSAGQDRRKTVGPNLSFAAAEAYKLLRTNITFSMADEQTCKVIGVTSALRGEGKSTTSLNLAYSLAESGKKTILVEADMRIPVVAQTLGIKEAPGLAHVLANLNSLNDSARPSGLLDKLYVMPAGEIPPNPAEMLSSRRMEKVVEALSQVFEYVIIDLPPINAVSDGLAVSKLLSGMIMVVRQDYCDQRALAQAMRQMDFIKVKLLGFVMNYAEAPEKHYKKYGRSYRDSGSHYGNPYRTAKTDDLISDDEISSGTDTH